MGKLVCWHCGYSLNDVPRPITRFAKCPECEYDLHVCRLCKFYNPTLSERCDHEMAEPAREIELANFCHYFRPRPDAFSDDKKSKGDDALEKLKSLFSGQEDNAKAPADGQPGNGRANLRTDKDAAKARFDDLFKK